MKDNIVEAVRQDLLERSQTGIRKYNTTLDRTDLSLRDWMQHAYEECLDQANYLKRSIVELDKAGKTQINIDSTAGKVIMDFIKPDPTVDVTNRHNSPGLIYTDGL
jgi:hypothetical protein